MFVVIAMFLLCVLNVRLVYVLMLKAELNAHETDITYNACDFR